MSMQASGFRSFCEYVSQYITGDEKGEAQVFLDRFFQALGYPDGFKGAGANCEFRIRNEESRSTRFADLVWKPVVLVEMKKRGEAQCPRLAGGLGQGGSGRLRV